MPPVITVDSSDMTIFIKTLVIMPPVIMTIVITTLVL